MIEWLQETAAGLLYLVLVFLTFGVAVFAGIWTAGRFPPSSYVFDDGPSLAGKVVGWIVGLATFATLIVIFAPATDSLQRLSCRSSSDYVACMGDD